MMSSTAKATMVKAASAIGTACLRCGRVMGRSNHGAKTDNALRHVSRGLCGSCYPACKRDGTIGQYPRIQRDRDEILDQYVAVREQLGEHATLKAVAEEMDLPRPTLSQYLARAAKDGDQRSDHYNRSPHLLVTDDATEGEDA